MSHHFEHIIDGRTESLERNSRTFVKATRQPDAGPPRRHRTQSTTTRLLPTHKSCPFAAVDWESTKRFTHNPFRFACTVCEHLWFMSDQRNALAHLMQCLRRMYPGRELLDNFRLCDDYRGFLCSAKVALISTCNGITYPEHSTQLPLLNCILRAHRIPQISIYPDKMFVTYRWQLRYRRPGCHCANWQ